MMQRQEPATGNDDVESADAKRVDEATMLIRAGDVGGAARVLLDVASRAPEPAEYRYQYERDGVLHVKFWDVEEFTYFVLLHKDQLKQSVVWSPSAYPRAMYYLGFLSVKKGDNAEAIRWLDAGQRLEPGQPTFKLEKAKALGGMKQHERALALYDEVARAAPQVRAALRAVAMRGKG